jgi:CRISPR-associated endonuclease/helicase Cas3
MTGSDNDRSTLVAGHTVKAEAHDDAARRYRELTLVLLGLTESTDEDAGEALLMVMDDLWHAMTEEQRRDADEWLAGERKRRGEVSEGGAKVLPSEPTEDSRLLASYWGKADPQMASKGPDHHTVLGHSLDVAACAFTLLKRNPVLEAQFAAQSGIPLQATALTFAAACALHDVGKIDTRFQRKAPEIADVLRPESRLVTLTKYDHGAEGFVQVEDDEAASARLLELFGESALLLLRAVCGHHGAFPARAEPNPNRSALPRALRREDEKARAVFVETIHEFFSTSGAVLPWVSSVDGAVVQRLGGLCAVADWLGSDVEHFPYTAGALVDLTDYWERACVRALSACTNAGLIRAGASHREFSDLFPGYTPRDVQLLTERVSSESPALTIVEAEMGKGKTEAALSVAARFLEAGLSDGITVALPTMATSNAMFDRVGTLVSRIFPGEHVQLALAHGRAARNSQMKALVERGLVARDLDAPEATASCARWLLKKKRILLAQVGVGTIDQALQAALVVRHQFVRMFGLSRNVIVIDEVHAYDAYMEVLLEHLLAWLGALNVPVILLSATLPSQRRLALARAWQGLSAEPDPSVQIDTAIDLESAISEPYPLVTVSTKTATSTLSGDSVNGRAIVLERCAPSEASSAHLATTAARLVRAARSGARVVWIRNTVGDAQRAYGAVAALGGDVEHLLFHARFRGSDRSEIERQVLDRFGKSAPPGGRVLIATQVVEQSLDLDFDELHTDLAPIDLIFQRAGRLHRHPRSRPVGFEEPRLVVHTPSDEDVTRFQFGPSQFVYDVGTLWIANRAIIARSALRIPEDIRLLVEETYHPFSRASLLSSHESLAGAERKRNHELEARRANARRCCIPSTGAEPDGQPFLDDDDEAVQAFTRDGVSTTLLPFLWSGTGARALDASSNGEAWNLDPASFDAWRLTGDLLDQTLSLPSQGLVEGAVEPADKQAWDAWIALFSRFAEQTGMGHRVIPLPMKGDSDGYKGWLFMRGKKKRVLYSKKLGLLMPRKKDEVDAQ